MSKLCCDIMSYYANESKDILEYEPFNRSYSFILQNSRSGTNRPFSCCPWCGKKLPKELDEEWGNVLKKELNIDVDSDEWIYDWIGNFNKLPKEFQTDEWWKKRGL